jgi:thiamine-phosphate pyrophosphorylase
MHYQFTPAAQRALHTAAGWTSRKGLDELETPALLLGLLGETECRAAMMLADRGVDAAAVRRRWPELMPRETSGVSTSPASEHLSADVELSLQAACERLADYPRPLEMATEHLLLGLVAADHKVSAWLREHGLEADALEAEIHSLRGHQPGPLPLAGALDIEHLPLDIDGHKTPNVQYQMPNLGGTVPVLRVLDAAANRAREGLRVVEDYVRFVLDDRHLTGRCKQLRHDLAATLGRIPTEHRLAARETQADVGTMLATPTESRRENAADVLRANFTRLEEALRSLEEFSKAAVVHSERSLETEGGTRKAENRKPKTENRKPKAVRSSIINHQSSIRWDLAAELKQLRYRAYTLHRAVEITRSSLARLDRARLYVLIDGGSSPEQFQRLAAALVEAGVHAIQLRDKQLDDRRLLDRARLLRELTRRSNTLFIMNDRPDLAVLSRADGLHVGQEELTVKDARTIVGPEVLIGVSTHTLAQARQAVLDGANYIGVGPVFPSGTKQFDEFPGVGFLRAVADEIRLPAFAIGGITRENVPEVLATGFTRVAVAAAITAATDPAAAARDMLATLEG